MFTKQPLLCERHEACTAGVKLQINQTNSKWVAERTCAKYSSLTHGKFYRSSKHKASQHILEVHVC